jgi:hypothetical protein
MLDSTRQPDADTTLVGTVLSRNIVLVPVFVLLQAARDGRPRQQRRNDEAKLHQLEAGYGAIVNVSAIQFTSVGIR